MDPDCAGDRRVMHRARRRRERTLFVAVAGKRGYTTAVHIRSGLLGITTGGSTRTSIKEYQGALQKRRGGVSLTAGK